MIARIVSVGACTSLGLSAEQTAFGLRAGLFSPRSIGHTDQEGEAIGAALVASVPEEIVGWERMVSLALPALRQVLRDDERSRSPAVFLAVPAPRPGFDGNDAALVAAEIVEATLSRGAELVLVTGGNEAFGSALVAAVRHLELHRGRPVVVGAVDTWHDPVSYEHLDREFRLLSGRAFNGFIPGEGAAFARLVAPDAEAPPALSDLVYAEAVDEDPRDELDAAWTDLVERGAIAATGEATIPWVLVDQRTERHRARSWDRVVYRLPDRIAPESTVTTTLAERLGDPGAASGAILMVHATVGLAAGFAPGASAVVALGSDWRGRACFTLARPPLPEPQRPGR